jgi:hypothetical protein
LGRLSHYGVAIIDRRKAISIGAVKTRKLRTAMSEITIIIVATLGLVLLAVAVVLAGLCLSRLGTLIETRDAMTRSQTRARLEVLAAGMPISSATCGRILPEAP